MKKIYIILFGVLVIYIILMIVLFADDSNETPNQRSQREEREKYFPIDENEQDIQLVNDNIEGVDKVQKQLKILGIDGYNSIKGARYEISSLNSENKMYLQKHFAIKGNLIVNQKIIFDFDSDGDKEQLILASNINNKNQNKTFSIVYYIDKSITVIKKNTYNEYNDNNIKYSLANIIDLNDDGNYEILLKISTNSMEYDCYDTYELNEGVYSPIILCDTSYLN